MMSRVSVADAKQHLSDLLGRVAYGKERIAITRRGKLMAFLIPPEQRQGSSHLADARGWLKADDHFFGVMNEIVEARSRHRPRISR